MAHLNCWAQGDFRRAARRRQNSSFSTVPSRALYERLQDMRGGAAALGEPDVLAFNADRELVLRTGKREAYPFLTSEQGALTKFAENFFQPLRA